MEEGVEGPLQDRTLILYVRLHPHDLITFSKGLTFLIPSPGVEDEA
jgi:hypothetical protein